MAVQSTLARLFTSHPTPALESTLKLFLASGGLLALFIQYLRIRNARRATGGGRYIEDLGQVRTVNRIPCSS